MIELTRGAADHVQQMLTARGRGVGLRLATRKSGCSGFAYVVDYADEITETDEVFETCGLKIIVDKNSLPYLNGSEVDYQKTNGLNAGFTFKNPNALDACGCGESFTV